EVAADEARAADDEEALPRAANDGDAGPRYLVDSHLVAARLSAGWLTSRCQTTAHRPSVCGVIRSGETVGITTQASACCWVAPPSLPTTPKIFAPTLLPSSMARTRFIDTFFSRLPPPTEKTTK